MNNPRFDTYVAVIFTEKNQERVRFVTGIPSRNTAEWNPGEPAMKLSEGYAKDIVFGLTLNGYTAAVIKFMHGVELRNPEKK